MKPWQLLVAVFAVAVYFAGLGAVPLFEPDEGRYAEIPREMLASGDFVTPRLDGVLYFEKPPLYYWLGAASRIAFGSIEFAARFWSALFGLGGIVLAYVLARSMMGQRAGACAALIIATTPLHLVFSRVNIIDPTLTFLVDAALVCFWLAQGHGDDRRAALLWHAMFAASALAVLCKGLIGIVIPAAVIALYIALAGQWRVLARVPWPTGVLVFLAIAVPWHVIVARRNPEFLWFYFVHEHLLRFSTPVASRQQPFWFFAAVLVPGLLPWCGLLPAAARRFASLSKLRRESPHLLFLAGWAGFVLVFFSASKSKMLPYVLPAILPIAVLAALPLAAQMQHRDLRSVSRWGMALTCSVLALIGGGLAWWSAGRIPWREGQLVVTLSCLGLVMAGSALYASAAWLRGDAGKAFWATGLAAALVPSCIWAAVGPEGARRNDRDLAVELAERLRPGDEVFGYRTYPQTLEPYLGRLVGTVESHSELHFGISQLEDAARARRFPSVAEFRPLWDSDTTVYLVAKPEDLPRMEADGLDGGRILKRGGSKLLLVNR